MIAWLPAALQDLIGPIDYVPLVRLLLAAALGATIGWERERHGRAAGLRTHLLLCLGCTLIMLVSLHLPALFLEYTADEAVRIDPGRVASQALSGLGFLGAGAIIVLGRRIRGLTTAACIWVTAAIGLAVGAGYMAPAIFTWFLVIFALLVVSRLEGKMVRKDSYTKLLLSFSRPGRRLPELRECLAQHGFTTLEAVVNREGDTTTYEVSLRYTREPDFEQATADLEAAFSGGGLDRLQWR
jgi:putative Mg2+ transporter-C (MgtC) family protein